jgi:mRNA interferase YafQ
MLKLVTTNQFEKDFDRIIKRGKNKEKIFSAMKKLLNEEILDESFRDHPLKGSLVGRREFHIEPDWLLIYLKKADRIIFERTGTHSDLFK